MPYYKVTEENGTKKLKDYSHPPKDKASDVSYDSSNSPLSATDVQGAIDELVIGNLIKNITYPVGTIIESTTCDTMAKVIATYGGTTWIQHSGYVLRGATSGVTSNDATKTGGSDTHTLTVNEMPSHNHGGATGGMNRNNPHSHATSNAPTWPSASATGAEWQVTFHSGDSQSPYTKWWKDTVNSDISHEHSISAQGGGQAFSVLENYKSVYIWERTE